MINVRIEIAQLRKHTHGDVWLETSNLNCSTLLMFVALKMVSFCVRSGIRNIGEMAVESG